MVAGHDVIVDVRVMGTVEMKVVVDCPGPDDDGEEAGPDDGEEGAPDDAEETPPDDGEVWEDTVLPEMGIPTLNDDGEMTEMGLVGVIKELVVRSDQATGTPVDDEDKVSVDEGVVGPVGDGASSGIVYSVGAEI